MILFVHYFKKQIQLHFFFYEINQDIQKTTEWGYEVLQIQPEFGFMAPSLRTGHPLNKIFKIIGQP
jgi:hypothetical protein